MFRIGGWGRTKATALVETALNNIINLRIGTELPLFPQRAAAK